MVGLSDLGLYQRTILVFHGVWKNTEAYKGNFTAPHRSEPLVPVAVDLTQSLWVVRGGDWRAARQGFLGSVSGRASKSLASVFLDTPKGQIEIFEYFSNDAPRRSGKAFRGTTRNPNGSLRYAQESYWWRYDDPAIMTPADRMAEIFDRAVRSPKLKAQVANQFGGLISPEALLPLAAIFACLFGAEFVGGVAAVRLIAGLIGVNQLICDLQFYEPRGKQLHRICMGAAVPKDLDEGADVLAEILTQLIVDVGTTLGISHLTAVATKIFSALIVAAPESVRLALKNNAHQAAAYIRGKGYARTDLLMDASSTPLEQAAKDMYAKSCENRREILVVREPDAKRLAWATSHMPQNAKPCMVKAGSSKGWHGLVCLERQGVSGVLKPAGTFDVNALRGFNPALDAEHLPARLPAYEMPTDGRKLDGIDYKYTGAGNIELKGHKLIDLGDKYLIVDALGRPYVSDLDLASRQRPGLTMAGAHLPGSGEDNAVLEAELNRYYHEAGGNPTHLPVRHGGRTASVGYNAANLAAGGKPGVDNFWGPHADTKTGFKDERLVIFLPEWIGGRIKAKMYAFEGWAEFQEFANANQLQFGFKKFSEVQAMPDPKPRAAHH